MGHDPQIMDFVTFLFEYLQKKLRQKGKEPAFSPEMNGVWRRIGNQIYLMLTF